MASLSQRQQTYIPTPLAAMDDPLAKDLMMPLPAYRARARAASSSSAGRSGDSASHTGGASSSPTSSSSPSSAVPPRGATHTQQWKPTLNRHQSFDPQVRKHEYQQHQLVEKTGPEDEGFTKRE